MRDHALAPRTVIQTLATSMVGLRSAELPPTSWAAAGACLIDWAGVTIGGAEGVMARALRTSAEVRTDGCRLLGTDERATPHSAALINGTAAHTLELDDIYAPGLFHPGAPVIASALAAAEASHASGRRLLRGIVAGYEVGGRVASDLGPAHYQMFHTTGTVGAIAAAAAAAEVLDLDEDRVAAALSIAATLGAGLQQTFRSSAVAKPLHAGHAAQVGIIAAHAAEHGGTGATDVLDGAAGLADAMGAGSEWVASRARFDSPYVVEQSTVKAYPCCGHTFAAIDAALALRDSAAPEDITEITVDTYAAAVDVAGIMAPQTSAEARFSIPYAVASAFVDGHVAQDTFDMARLAEPERRRLTAATSIRSDAAFTARSPQARGAELTVVLRDGTRHRHLVPDRFGSPSNPLPEKAIEQKFLDLVAAVYGADRAADILIGLRGIAQAKDVACLDL